MTNQIKEKTRGRPRKQSPDDVRCSVTLGPAVIRRVDVFADRATRTRSAEIRVLIMEALEARKRTAQV